MEKPIVSVVMITYGHEKFIEEAIYGVLMQESSFGIELIIANDCSLDNTDEVIQNIIKEHPRGNWIKYTKHEKNIGMMPNFIYALNEAKGKYIALCEGDDYWTDSLKLQRQVDFLEANPDYGLVHTDYEEFLHVENKFNLIRKSKSVKNCSFKSLLIGSYIIGTLTVCFRKEFYDSYLREICPHSKKWQMGDLPLWLYISQKSKIHFINEVTCVYRLLSESASNTQNVEKKLSFEKSLSEIRCFFLEKYTPNDIKYKRKIESLTIYKKIIVNHTFNDDYVSFIKLFFQFHKINRDAKLFFGSFKQLYHKFYK